MAKRTDPSRASLSIALAPLKPRSGRSRARLPKPIARYLREATGAYTEPTLKALEGDFARFQAWCRAAGEEPLPTQPATVAAYVSGLAAAGRCAATVRRYLASLAHLHRALGHPDPTGDHSVRLALRRLSLARPARPSRPAPIDQAIVERLLAPLGDIPIDRRDRALVLVARDTLCRRLELTDLQFEDLVVESSGAGHLLVRRGKADAVGEGRIAWLAPETVAAIQAWCATAGITDGAIFRATINGRGDGRPLTPEALARRFKVLAARAGLDPTRYSCHSTRIGTAVELIADGASLVQVQLAGGWASPRMPALYAKDLLPHLSAVAQWHARRQGMRPPKQIEGPRID